MKIKGSFLWAGAIVLGLAAWLGSGQMDMLAMVGTGGDATENTGGLEPELTGLAARDSSVATDADGISVLKKLPRVRVKVLASEKRFSELVVRGRTEAARSVDVRGETPGIVIKTPIKKGARVKTGDVLCLLDMADRQSALSQAKAALEWASLDYKVAQNLGKKGYGAKNKEMAQRATYDAAKATLARAELDIARTQITAPFDGIVEARAAQIGDYVSVGGACATVVELSPLLVVGYVGEREVGKLEVGQTATAELATGQTVEGAIRFISSSADAATRTFRIEVEIKNSDFSVKDGVTADIHVPLKPVKAHRFSPAVLTLRDDGVIGVRIVDADDRVVFVPVIILASDAQGIWVSGLPPSPAVIVVGHEYVQAGQKVERVLAVPAKTAENAE